MPKKVLGVGHCGYDSGRISQVVSSLGAVFENAADCEQALSMLKADKDIIVVIPNRVIGSDELGGVKTIKAIKADADISNTPVLLVSGIDSAQQQAEDAGAERGFSKDHLDTGAAALALKKYLE